MLQKTLTEFTPLCIVVQINSVLTRRGIPLWVPAAGRHKALPLHGQNFPGHLYVMVASSSNDTLFMEILFSECELTISIRKRHILYFVNIFISH